MHITARIFLLRVVDIRVQVSCERPITAGGVGEESAAPLHGDVGGLLHRLDRKVPRRLHHDTAVATHPGDNARPILVVMAAPRLACLAATPGVASQRLLAARLGLSLLAGGVREVIGFDRPCQLTTALIGQGGIAQPPTPAIARADMEPHLFGNTPRCTREAQQKSGENPMPQRALAAIQQRASEVIEGALAVFIFTAAAFQSRLVMVRTPRTDVVALTVGTLEWAIFPP